MQKVVVVILDGLRRDFVTPEYVPNVVQFAARAESFVGYRSVFPSATRVVSATFSTGCLPARHELQGNSMALLEDGALVGHDAGHPEFLQHKRTVTGRSLAVPTLAERLADHGEAVIFNNASPGAAYAHDPDGHGWVHHRAGSFGPGRRELAQDAAALLSLDAAGDRIMAQRFIEEVLNERCPALAVFWCCEPDHTQHNSVMGSPEHVAVLAEADKTASMIIAEVDRLRARGDDILLIVGSDHGHQTVRGVIDVEAELVGAGFKAGAESSDVIALSNGTSTLIYVHPDHAERIAAIGEFLEASNWSGIVVPADKLSGIGQSAANHLAFAVSMAEDDDPNAYGVRGQSLVAKPAPGKSDCLGFGQHGGLAKYEQQPFLLIDGAGFQAGTERTDEMMITSLAPTILTHLGLPANGMDGRPLQNGR